MQLTRHTDEAGLQVDTQVLVAGLELPHQGDHFKGARILSITPAGNTNPQDKNLLKVLGKF